MARDDGMVDIGGGAALHVHGVGEGSPMVLIERTRAEAPDRVVTAAWQVVSSARSRIPLSRSPA
jgi:hypothetical protein